jgi:hypothetical protein
MSSLSEEDLARLHEVNRKLDGRVRQALIFGAARQLDPRRVLARQIERQVRERIDELGIVVTGTRHKENFDLLAQGVRIEVKASRWYGKRYEANLHNNEADVLVFGCLDSDVHYFVIPFGEVRGRSVIQVTSHDPRDYFGRWMRWYGAWNVIGELVAAGCNAWQPALMWS